jgi:hypothetical protein
VKITAIRVQMDGEACREVDCTIAGQPARFAPEFWGNFVDLEAVLRGLNDGLAAGGLRERFANLRNDDPIACVIVGHDAGLAKLAETLGLPLDVDTNGSIVVAAEQHAAADIVSATDAPAMPSGGINGRLTEGE